MSNLIRKCLANHLNHWLSLCFILSVGLLSCKNENQYEELGYVESKIVLNNQGEKDSYINDTPKAIFYGLYSPVEVSTILSDVELEYKPEYFLPTEWAKEYSSSSKLAIGLGLYGADFSMIKMFSNTEDAIKYMEAISILSEKLGVPPELLNEFSQRVGSNISNIDSLSMIAFETFSEVSDYLVDSGREHSMSLILLGGWTEGLYIAMKYIEEDGKTDKKIIEKVIEHKYSLNFLMPMLKNEYQDPIVAHYYRLLKVLQNHFDNLSISYKKNQVEVDLENYIINSDWQQISYSKSELDLIKWIVSGIREEMSNP